ncbi:dephospho-CoA kinase [Desulforamulus hydrothermalis]|uniref:Dephospho-CoA kinase n=1 Tax=Desulforamulus hydrothermalis Lam5 = DSM 18033 TaxID=1121428 RepID=K8DXH5_9FIRM|nr:dephospho-CoA kinase [Desulforamulus hydrothermalis]CCO07284.1 Dephospho-CoA kinase [Desulforamulus hydrothermalis Lam5 = DSM 18033]SHG93150.1 dephospho-CoA kinase [Desulforamulus hydrothermalis Lam5 = DSM 18033]
MLIGLTGNIASGKSTVAKYLKELGAQVIDADQVARQVVLPHSPALKEIVNSFGPGILHEDGTLNRAKLASVIFQDAAAKEKLENILHPRIADAINRQISSFKKSHPGGILVLEAPLLIEAGWHKSVDQVWLVTVDPQLQLQRLILRDKLTPEQARQRMASQMPQEEKKKFAHVIINNAGSPSDLQRQVQAIWHSLPAGY